MRYTNNPLRPGLTAIAAVLALSSTPLLAQEAAAPPMVTPPPVVVPPAAPVVQSSAPVTAAPLITPPAPTVSATTAPSTTRTVASLPAREPVVERASPVQRAAPRTVTAAAPAARAATAAPVEAAPVATPAPAPEPAAPAPVAFEPAAPAPAPAPANTSNDILPIAGAAGAAILLLGDGAYAMFGRRRREDEEVVYRTDDISSSAPVPVAPLATPPVSPAVEPGFAFAQPGVTQPMASPEAAALRDVPVTRLPAGFDLSRYGRHVQAAYRGPTEDNRSLSLRRRLAHARFYDQRERMAAPGNVAPSAQQPAVGQPVAARTTEYVTTKVKQQPRPGFRPAYSS